MIRDIGLATALKQRTTSGTLFEIGGLEIQPAKVNFPRVNKSLPDGIPRGDGLFGVKFRLRGLTYKSGLEGTDPVFVGTLVLKRKDPGNPSSKVLEYGDLVYGCAGRLYVVDATLSHDDASALVADRVMSNRRKIDRAKDRLVGVPGGGRERIPDAVKLAVWERDGGRCVRCGSTQDLQYDHDIPLAMGGSNEIDNLQILCAPCNRAKGPNLV